MPAVRRLPSALPPKRFEVTIEKIVAGGDGLGRHQGRIVFVPETAPGERHLVEVIQEKKDFLRARSVSCAEPSDARRQAPCRYYGRCGGCSLMHLSVSAQLDAKRSVLLESLARSGAAFDGAVEVVRSPSAGYRTRVRFHLARRGGKTVMGFRRRGSHHVHDVAHCLLAHDGVNSAWQRLRALFAKEPSLAKPFSSVELQQSTDGEGRICACFVVRSKHDLRKLSSGVVESLRDRASLDGVAVATEPAGRPEADAAALGSGFRAVYHPADGFTLRQSAGSFFQTNRFLLEELIRSVGTDGAVRRAIDLYCGVGLLTLPLARGSETAIGVESAPGSVRDAIANANAAGVRNVRFLEEDVAGFAKRFEFSERDHVVVDPPRGGLARELVHALGESPIQELRYVSCDPPALGRDADRLGAAGFRIRSVRLLDFFPHTHHFEVVVRFTRAPLDSAPPDGRY